MKNSKERGWNYWSGASCGDMWKCKVCRWWWSSCEETVLLNWKVLLLFGVRN